MDDKIIERIESMYLKLQAHGLARREGQVSMSMHLAQSIASGRIGVAEAGTGIGKSYASLIAAIAARDALQKRLAEIAKQNGTDEPERITIVYSTGTIALQEQIIQRDLPNLLDMLGLDLGFELAKGRGRYFCPNKVMASIGNAMTPDLFGDEFDEVETVSGAVADHLSEMLKGFDSGTWNGDLDDWPGEMSPASRQAASIEASACSRRNCAFYDSCPFFKARKRLFKTDIIVTNHSLLLSDLAAGGGKVIPAKPENTIYLIDEAHRIPETAIQQFGATFQVEGSLALASNFVNAMGRLAKGIAVNEEAVIERINDAGQAGVPVRDALKELLDAINANEKSIGKEGWTFDEPPEAIAEPVNRLSESIKTCLKSLKAAANTLEDADVSKDAISKAISRVGFFSERFSNIQRCLDALSEKTSPIFGPVARWIEIEETRQGPRKRVNAFPISAAELLHQHFWDKAAAAAVFSATLRSLGNFNLFASNSGLTIGRRFDAEHFLSGFPYERSTLYLASGDIDPNHEQHPILTAQVVIGAAQKADGGILGLFTSRKYMEQVLDIITNECPDVAKDIIAQGSRSKAKMLEIHKRRIEKGKRSILFGLASFAEGVDLPGKQCTVVIIPRIPFAVPDTPIEKKRIEWIKKNGGNPFMDYALPTASVRVTQMAGRLNRQPEDEGMVIFVDPRITSKRYGQSIVRNLPPFSVRTFSLGGIAQRSS